MLSPFDDTQILNPIQPCNQFPERRSFREDELLLETSRKIGDPKLACILEFENPSPKSATKHTKDCLKFCRKLSNVFLYQLNVKSKIIHDVLRLNSEALTTLIPLMDLNSVSISELENFQFRALIRLWTDFKELLSCQKNKKICVVKQEYWDLIFDKATCVEALKKIFRDCSQLQSSVMMRLLIEDYAFSAILARLLYCSSNVIALILTLQDSSETGVSLRNLKTIDNFIVMMVYPSYIQLYNHRAGKFALECCNRCKICCSKKVPVDFLNTIRDSRQRVKEFSKNLTHILETSSPNDVGAIARILELAINNF